MALPQMVGFHKEKIRGQRPLFVAAKQWLHAVFPAFEYVVIHIRCIPWNVQYPDFDFHCDFKLCHFYCDKSCGYTVCLSGTENL